MFGSFILREGRSRSDSKRQMQEAGKRLGLTVVRIQLLVLAAMVSLAMGFGMEQALSALMGSLASIVPFTLFVYLAFAFSGARLAQTIVRAFYLGEAIKITSSLLLLVLALLLFKTHAEWVLVAFVVTMIPILIGPLFLKTR